MGLEFGFATLDEIGDEGDYRGDFASSQRGDLSEGAALAEQVECFKGGIGGTSVPFFAGAFAAAEAFEGSQRRSPYILHARDI